MHNPRILVGFVDVGIVMTIIYVATVEIMVAVIGVAAVDIAVARFG